MKQKLHNCAAWLHKPDQQTVHHDIANDFSKTTAS